MSTIDSRRYHENPVGEEKGREDEVTKSKDRNADTQEQQNANDRAGKEHHDNKETSDPTIASNYDEEKGDATPSDSVARNASRSDVPPSTAADGSLHAPGAYYVRGVDISGHSRPSIDEGERWTSSQLMSSDSSLPPPVAAHVVDAEEDERRMQELEEQNRMLLERENRAVVARLVEKTGDLKSFITDPEFRRQRLCVIAFVLLVTAAIVIGVILGVVLPEDDDDSDETTATLPPTPQPTTEVHGSLSEFLAEYASFDGGVALVDQETPQYQAVKWLANNAHLDDYTDKEKIQRYALAALYFSTKGNNWTVNENWLDDGAACGRWLQADNEALPCTSEGDVNELFLVNNNLQGSIPPELALLSGSIGM